MRQVLQAMRGGNQPIWFLYGNDLFAHPEISPPQYTALYGRKMRVLGVAWPSIVLHFPVLPRPSRRAQTGR